MTPECSSSWNEVQDFCHKHMPEIRAQDFFHKLLYDRDVQIPLLLVLVEPALKNDIVVKAYGSLREAVERKFPKEKQPRGASDRK